MGGKQEADGLAAIITGWTAAGDKRKTLRDLTDDLQGLILSDKGYILKNRSARLLAPDESDGAKGPGAHSASFHGAATESIRPPA